MPWSASDTIPAIQGKSLKLRQLFAEVANSALAKGRTEEEAIFAGLAAVKNEEKKLQKDYSVSKVNYKPPSHIQALIEASKKQKEEVKKTEVKEAEKPTPTIKQAFLPANAIEPNSERSLVSANFDERGRLVFVFDDGKKIITDSVHQTVENYVSVVTEQIIEGGTGGANIKHFDATLSGLTLTYTKQQHKFEEIVSIYFLKNGKDVSLDWEFTTGHDLVIRSNLDMTGIKLIAHGKG